MEQVDLMRLSLGVELVAFALVTPEIVGVEMMRRLLSRLEDTLTVLAMGLGYVAAGSGIAAGVLFYFNKEQRQAADIQRLAGQEPPSEFISTTFWIAVAIAGIALAAAVLLLLLEWLAGVAYRALSANDQRIRVGAIRLGAALFGAGLTMQLVATFL